MRKFSALSSTQRIALILTVALVLWAGQAALYLLTSWSFRGWL